MEFRRITNLPPVRLHDHQQPEDRGTASGRRRDRPRVRQPRHPLAGDRRREAGRGRPHRPQPPLLDVAGACPSCARRSPRLYERNWGVDARPRAGDHQHDRLEGGLQPPHVGAAEPRRRRHRAQPELPDPHLRPAVRRRRPAPGADAHLVRRPRPARTSPATSSTASRPPGTSAGPSPGCWSSRSRTTRPGPCVDLDVHAAGRRLLPRARDDRRARLRLRRRRLRRLRAAVASCRPRGQGVRRRAVLDDQELLDGRLARARSWSATPRSCRRW